MAILVEILKSQMDELFEKYDILLTPTMAVTAFPLGEFPTTIAGKDVNPRLGYLPFTPPFNLTGQPAASIPCGFSEEGLPVGLHIIGRKNEETTVLHVSAAFEEAKPWDQRLPQVS